MFISLNNGTVLTVFPNGRPLAEIKAEVSARIANVEAGGNLLDRGLNVIASFNFKGEEIKS